VHFAYDIGFAIDLDEAERLIKTAKQREAIRHKRRAPPSVQYHPAPLRVTQSGPPVHVGQTDTNPGADIVLYDFGAASVAYSVPLRGSMTALLELSNALYGNAALLTDSRQRVEQVLAAIRPAVTNPAVVEIVEDYFIFHIESPQPAPD